MDNAKFASYRDNNLIRSRQVLKSLLILVVVYCLLMACWPVLGRGYARLYRAGGALLFGSFGSKGKVLFDPIDDPPYDTLLSFANVGRKDANGRIMWVQCGCTSRRGGYIYIMFVVALIAATPVSVRRKLWALLWGLILVNCLIAVKLGVRIIDVFSKEPLRLFVISPFWEMGFHLLYRLMVNLTFGFIVSTFIWILVTFRREDWRILRK